MKTASSPIKGFDGVRAGAISAVILTHINVHGALYHRGYLSEGLVNSVNGSAGVQAFFVLSGFLITHLLIQEQHKTEQVSLRNFYIRRALRILPVYLLVVSAALAMEVMVGKVASGQSFLYAYTYTYNFIPEDHYSSVLGHTWSLAVEEHFYLVWPFIFAAAAARSRPLMVSLLIFVPAALLLHLALATLPSLAERYFLHRWSFFAGINIAFGCIGALLMDREHQPRLLRWLTESYGGLAVGCLLWFVEALPLLPQHIVFGYVRALGFFVIILWIFRSQQSLVVHFLELPPIKYIGVISYGLYMYQGFYLATSPWRGPDQMWPPDRWTGLLLLAVTAPLSYHLLEKPILRLKRRYQSDGRAGAAAGRRGPHYASHRSGSFF
jgi:peptidoglycan/LPS O-acetylase OafA/YrhL